MRRDNEQLSMNNEQSPIDNIHRPNSKYKLSYNSNNSDTGLNFRYNRERRLESAPETVKGLYKSNNQNRFSLLGPLLADKPRRMLFVIIILLSLSILALSIFGYFDTVYSLDGNRIDITAAGFEGTTIIILRKTVQNKDAYSGAVDIAVSPAIQTAEDNINIFSHRVFFSMESEEVYRFAAPFDSKEILMVIQNEKESVRLKIKPN